MRLNPKCVLTPYESALHINHGIASFLPYCVLHSVLHLRRAVIWDAAQRFALLRENGGQNARRDAEGQLKGTFIIILLSTS